MMSPGRLAKWVLRAPKNTDNYQLYFLSGDETSELLQTWEKSEVWSQKTDEFCESVLALCQDDCNEERRLESRYRLAAFAGEKVVAQQTIRVKPSDDGVLDDPLGIGATAGHSTNNQLVRMNEVTLRMFVSYLKTSLDGWKAIIDAQSREIVQLREQIHEITTVLQAATLRQLDVDTEDSARSKVALDKLANLIEKHAPQFLGYVAETVSEKGVPSV
jgi:hypothetical protein